MKFTNKITLIVLGLFLSLFVIQCSNDDGLFQEVFDEPIVYASLDEVRDSLISTDSIYFELLDNETDTTFTTPGGIRLLFPPNSIVQGGSGGSGGGGSSEDPVPPFSIQVLEIYKRSDFVRHNIQTYDDNNPLVSGGAFHVLVIDSQGNQFALEGVEAFVPYQTDADTYQNSMLAFKPNYLVTPNNMITSWEEITTPISFDPNADVNGEFHHPNVLAGWNHIGSHLNMAEPTQFSMKISNVENYENSLVYFVMDEFTTVTGIFYPEGDTLEAYFDSVPKDATGKLIAISLIEGQLHFASQDITINGDDQFDLTVAPGTIEELQALLDSVD